MSLALSIYKMCAGHPVLSLPGMLGSDDMMLTGGREGKDTGAETQPSGTLLPFWRRSGLALVPHPGDGGKSPSHEEEDSVSAFNHYPTFL